MIVYREVKAERHVAEEAKSKEDTTRW